MALLKKKINRIITAITGIVIIILAFLPFFIKRYVISNSKKLLGRQIDIGSLKYNYFSSTAKVYDFKMLEQNGKDEFTSFDTLIINIEPYRFLLNEKVIEQFYLKGLEVKIVMQDSSFNFDDLIAFHTQDSISVEEENSESFKYSISNIELKDANFIFDNQNVGKETQIEDLSFVIPYIGWDQEEKSNADIKFNFQNGGYFQSSLNINPVDGEFDAKIEVKDLYLEPFLEYVREYADINSFNGRLTTQIEVKGNTNDAVSSVILGRGDVNDFIMTDLNDKEFLKAQRIDFYLKKIDYFNSSYEFDTLSFTEPYAYFEMDSITNNFFKIFKLNPDGSLVTDKIEVEQGTDSLDSDSKLYYAINNLIVQKGVLDYSDNLTGEIFEYHLSDITINSKDLASDLEWIDIYSEMLLNGRGTLNSKLSFNPSDYTNLNLDLAIENFLLSDLNIYSKYYTGHSIVQGDFYYYSKSLITNGNIESENNLLVKNVSVSNEKGGLYSLPLKFAIFLLKDKNGDVNLEIPVRGDLNDPEVSVGKIIWNTFKNLIVRAASAPVNLLAGLVDGDPKEFEEITFSYTDTIPSEKQFRKLDKLLEMESKKEGLKIELIHFVDPELQKEAIVLSELGNQYFKDTNKDYLDDEKGFESYLRAKVENDSISTKDAAFQLITPQSADSLATIYNETLLKNTINYLKIAKDSTNITVVKSEIKEPDNIGSQSRFKIVYDMLDEQNMKTAANN